MSDLLCPTCAMGKLQQEKKHITVSKYGLSKSSDIEVLYCPVCEFESPVHTQDALVRKNLVKYLEQENARNILRKMAEENINFASLERALSLPQRTLSKWKQGATKPSEAGIVLLNLLAVMPWLSQIVDHDYDPNLVLAIQWRNICNSIRPVETGILYNGLEKVLYAYSKQEIIEIETEKLSPCDFSYGEVIHEVTII